MSEAVIKLEWEAANQLVHHANQIIIVTHLNPDGDAIGSMLGIGLALRERGKQVTMAVDGGVPRDFRFIPGTETVLGKLTDLPPADLIISTDASSFDRVGEVGAAAFALDVPKIIVDHHPTNTYFGNVTLLNSEWVSTTEAILEWLDHLGWEPSPDVAMALMTGLVTDTISFRVGPVTSETFSKAQRLMRYGVDLRGIGERTLGRVPSGSLPLNGIGLSRAKIEDHIIYTYLKIEDFNGHGFTLDQKPELATQLLSDEDAYIAAYFLETETGDIRVSFRAKPVFDVASVAFALGGGGHKLAAGCTIEQSSVEDAIAKVLPMLKETVQQGELVYKLT